MTEPFDECGGTTHVLRLNWSPDGQYVVSAHAMNNGGPVAKIIERDGWKARMDFVGHRKAITCVVSERAHLCQQYHFIQTCHVTSPIHARRSDWG